MCNLRPTSRGHVRIKSADPDVYPAIKLNYLSTEEDRKVAVDSIRFTRRIMAARALKHYPVVVMVSNTVTAILADWRRQTSYLILAAVMFELIAVCAAFLEKGHQIAIERVVELALAVTGRYGRDVEIRAGLGGGR